VGKLHTRFTAVVVVEWSDERRRARELARQHTRLASTRHVTGVMAGSALSFVCDDVHRGGELHFALCATGLRDLVGATICFVRLKSCTRSEASGLLAHFRVRGARSFR
jgi:hypothetical protein